MRLYRTLMSKGSKEHPRWHYNTVVSTIKRVLGPESSDPDLFADADSFAVSYLSRNIRRKEAAPYGVPSCADERKQAALTGFLLREHTNKMLNETRTFGYDPVTGEYRSDRIGDKLLYEARDIIHAILGTSPNLRSIVNSMDFGNGASATLRRTDAQRQRKFEHGLSATRGLHAFIHKVINECPAWTRLIVGETAPFTVSASGETSKFPVSAIKIYGGSVLDYVPKDASIDRIIIKEPELNGFVQKGIGNEMRKLLRSYRHEGAPDGVNLNTSGSFNSELARLGSLSGLVATVDGERASDSLYLALFEFLLPEAWFNLLSHARSPFCLINGKWHRLQMMSGMGNGFTFELQSIVFYAIGLAAAKRSKISHASRLVSIHGDDLTVPNDVYSYVVLAYKAAGVTVNQKKSFSSGVFRESCGGHFFSGRSVKPFYVKDQTGKTHGDWFWLRNSLVLWLLDRSSEFLRGSKGKDLIQIARYLTEYSRQGTTSPVRWVAPFDASRRSGCFSWHPPSKRKCYKTLRVVDKARKGSFTDEQSYVAWLCSPPKLPSMQDLVQHKGQETDPYEYDEEVDERVRWTNSYTWSAPSYGQVAPPLWALLDLHNGHS